MVVVRHCMPAAGVEYRDCRAGTKLRYHFLRTRGPDQKGDHASDSCSYLGSLGINASVNCIAAKTAHARHCACEARLHWA